MLILFCASLNGNLFVVQNQRTLYGAAMIDNLDIGSNLNLTFCVT
jgi:hypothetical protein